MTNFDTKQQASLKFLTQRKAYVHFPFFANTFSLPYHYANALRGEEELSKWEDARKLLVEHNWENPIPVALGNLTQSINVFYATKEAFETFRNDPQKSAPWDLDGVAFTKYKPVCLFTDFRAFVARTLSDGKYNGALTENLMKSIKNQGVFEIELLTDIPNQTEILCKHLEHWGFSHKVYTVREPVDALHSVDPRHRILRLYFYGAPTTAKMLADPIHFIRIGFPSEFENGDDSTITQICLALPKGKDEIEKEENRRMMEEFRQAMVDYHARIFEVANQDEMALLNVWWAYNRYAERKQHAAMFKSPKAFADCLSDHHESIK